MHQHHGDCKKYLGMHLLQILFLNCLVYKMSEKNLNSPLQVYRDRDDVLKCLVLSNSLKDIQFTIEELENHQIFTFETLVLVAIVFFFSPFFALKLLK